MVFEQPEGFGVALYIQREALMAAGRKELAREDACRLARKELQEAGYGSEDISHVEAFENQGGWMVFAAAQTDRKSTYYHFAECDHFLDALNSAAAPFAQIQRLKDGSVIAKLQGSSEALRRASLPLSEYGSELDGSELYIRHLCEH